MSSPSNNYEIFGQRPLEPEILSFENCYSGSITFLLVDQSTQDYTTIWSVCVVFNAFLSCSVQSTWWQSALEFELAVDALELNSAQL